MNVKFFSLVVVTLLLSTVCLKANIFNDLDRSTNTIISHPYYNPVLNTCVGIWTFSLLKELLVPHLHHNDTETTVATLCSLGGACGASYLAQKYPGYATVTCVVYGLYCFLHKHHRTIKRHMRL